MTIRKEILDEPVRGYKNSLTYISQRDRKAVVSDLKPIYTAVTEDKFPNL